MSEQLLKQIGENWYGENWQAPLARDLDVGERSMRRWVAGTDPIPQGVWRDLQFQLEARLNYAQFYLGELKTALGQVEVTAFEVWDSARGDKLRGLSKSTRARIARIGGTPIDGTSDWVDPTSVDAEGRLNPVDKDNLQAMMFAEHACQYYATARFAMYAQRMPICGNLFHHAIEMALKGGLARRRELSELRYMGHDLKALWRAFKKDFPAPGLERHDKTISRLNKYEDIRYPGTEGSIAINAAWSGDPGTVTTSGGLRAPKKYPLVVSDIDNLFADIFRASSWDPRSPSFMGTNAAALEAVRLLNDQSVFLTGKPTLTQALQTGVQP